MAGRRLGAAGLAMRLVGALVLVYATFNPTGRSYFHWVLAPLLGLGPETGGSSALKFLLGMVLLIGWVVVLQATRRSIGLAGAFLALALCGGLIWLLVEQHVVSPTGTAALAHIGLIAIALVLAVGMSWSLLTRRLTGQVDTDRVD
ncbi:MAG TPA: DUF6524 family protein [Gemmatimonadales bacterium]|jgi:hypothetical protein|nr:DUF6524 family protein [Gemmatimonadales bacterium]